MTDSASSHETTTDRTRAAGVSRRLLTQTLAYARERDYTGWDYGDGMSSRLLQSIPIDNKWCNIAVQETIKRAPVNVRPLFFVEQRRNFMGTGLFAMANLVASQETGDGRYREEAAALCDWLIDHQAPGYSGFCGAHRHQIQHLSHKGEPEDPDVVSTIYGVRALLRASQAGLDRADEGDDETNERARPGDGARAEEYAAVARTAAEFVLDDLEYHEIEAGARIKYVPTWTSDHYTLNAVALGGVLLLDLYDHFGEEDLRERGTRLLEYVASRQTDVGGWFYRDPPAASHLSMDNHHNGFIVESFLRYEQVVGDGRFDDVLEDGLDFYRETLFAESGAPNWDESSAYPRDIHAAAQGIIVFSLAGELDRAERVLDWVLGALYAGDGRFHYRRERHYTRRVTLMRWCEAWMAYAIATYLDARDAHDAD